MNWRVTVPAGPIDGFAARAKRAKNAPTAVNPAPSAHVDEQFEAACAAAESLLDKVQLDPEGHVEVRLEGYAAADENSRLEATQLGIVVKVVAVPGTGSVQREEAVEELDAEENPTITRKSQIRRRKSRKSE